MRFYGFSNYYLSSLQQSLQAHHAAQEIYNKYFPSLGDGAKQPMSPTQLAYDNWSRNHKTVVLLNGGNSADLKELAEFFQFVGHDYAHASFHEDEASLGGALTSVGIILPASIYDAAANDRKKNYAGMSMPRPRCSPWEEELIIRLNTYGLAK